MSRLFVAVRPPEQVLDAVAALERPDEPGVRYTGREQWHITVRFLGEADEGAARAALDNVDAGPAEAVLGPRVSRLGRSVIVLPVSGLDALVAAVVVATADVGEPPDPRPFNGHLTVARLRRRGACRIAGAALSASFPVTELELVRSDLRPEGARYEVVATRSLTEA